MRSLSLFCGVVILLLCNVVSADNHRLVRVAITALQTPICIVTVLPHKAVHNVVKVSFVEFLIFLEVAFSLLAHFVFMPPPPPPKINVVLVCLRNPTKACITFFGIAKVVITFDSMIPCFRSLKLLFIVIFLCGPINGKTQSVSFHIFVEVAYFPLLSLCSNTLSPSPWKKTPWS